MFIVAGTKVSKKYLGRLANFCPICRKFQPFQAVRVESYVHLYYLPIGRRKTLGFTKTCETCSIMFPSDAFESEEISRDRTADLEALLSRTSSEVLIDGNKRLDRENRLRQRKLTPEERVFMIQEPFMLLNPWIDERGRALEKDLATVLGLIATVVIPLVILLVTESISPGDPVLWTLAAVIGVLLLLTTFYFMATTTQRYLRRVLIPRLAQTLRPLNPSREEIEATIQHLRQSGLRIGQRIDSDALMEALHTPQFD